jgi:hypothetical protein
VELTRATSVCAPTRGGSVDLRRTARRVGDAGDRRRPREPQEATVKYMLLIYADPTQGPAEGTPEAGEYFASWGTYSESLRAAGVMREGDPLQPPDTATTISRPNGERVVTDGPFADTKEWLGGYYIIEVDDLDAALGHAERMPHVAHGGSVEVRPVMAFEGM